MRSSFLTAVVIAQLFLIVTVSGATSFGCKNALISDEWRETVLNFHNKIRRKVAEGKQPTKTPGQLMPKADDMIELTWDCDIENNAFLSTCDQNTVQIPQDYSANSATLTMTGKKCNIKDNTMTVLKKWYDQVKLADFPNGAKYNDQSQKEFGIMVFGATTGFACSYSKCGSNGKLLCLYNQPTPANNADLYNSQQPTTCGQCPQGTTCVDWLCRSDNYTPDLKANPLPDCPNPQPGQLGDDKMTYDMQMTARDMANYYRNLVATGWAQDKNGYAPTAKAMNALKYDCANAGNDAKTIIDCANPSYTSKAGLSVNYYTTRNLNLPKEEVLKEAMSTWYSQLKNVDLDKNAVYDNNVQNSASSFANMVIGDATVVGCSVETCTKEGYSVAVCEFDGTAPTDGDSLYTVGKTCSGCGTCHKELPGLCA
ncbi:SCP-like protein [Ancylostoma caninum]|uniref:SCP-like protein n=1 Tax=Ancylostoma caninum TaxID=29170 RepID=A0A368GS20_ANCCA|nr:SCP-like protein [Ancylostoma caninum]